LPETGRWACDSDDVFGVLTMARRKIVRIDEEKCDGCGKCVTACVEGAIALVNGKAKLVSETYCDGLGACLGECPQGAISIEEREAAEFDEAAAKQHIARKEADEVAHVCPGSMAKRIERTPGPAAAAAAGGASQLGNWPVQLKLVPPDAPYFEEADLLLVADCVPFALGDFHSSLLRGRPVVVGCPKLDDPDYYAEKLADILKCSSVKSLTVVHMEVPCCSALARIAEAAIRAAGKDIPLRDVTVGIQGEIVREESGAEAPTGGGCH